MALDLATWHARFRQQAGWTRELRQNLLRRAGMAQARSVLDVGAATGAVTGELSLDWQARVFGLDQEWTRLAYARLRDPRTCFTQADAHFLPYRSGPQGFLGSRTALLLKINVMYRFLIFGKFSFASRHFDRNETAFGG